MEYTEILKLKEMLEKADIPFTFTDDSFNVKDKPGKNRAEEALYRRLYPAYQIRLGDLADVIEHRGSYGHEQDLLEIMGGLTEEEMEYDSILGYLTAEEVFKRFKYCWEHQTSVYKEVKDMKYDRLTAKRETPLTMSMWPGDSESLKVYNRLAELEDRIENGELVEVPQVVKKFAEKLKSHVILNYTMDGEFVEGINIWSLFKDIDDLVTEMVPGVNVEEQND